MNKKKLFLASSAELSEDRKEFELFINRKNKNWVDKGVFLELVVWEDFLDAVSRTRLQDEYNKEIRTCDLFVMLFFTKVGQYTEEEFETAFGQFQSTNKPFIFTYFKDAEISTGSANKRDLMSLWAFQEKLDALGHFYTRYKNIDELKFHFNRQLDKLAETGFIEFHPQQAETQAGTAYQAHLTGNGTIAQGAGATAVGASGVSVGGNNSGNINTGTQTHVDTGGGAYIKGNVSTGGGDFVGRDQSTPGFAAAETETAQQANLDSGTDMATQGGAAIEGAVQVRGGHFIGRDFIQQVTQVAQVTEDPEEAKSVIALYLHALVLDLVGLKLGEIDVAAQETSRQPLRLADIYVPLDTTLHIPENETLLEWLSRDRARQASDPREQRETRPISAIEALAAHRELTLLGKPGSGKSTFGSSALLALAQAWQGHGDQLGRLGETWTQDPLLPIRIVLRRFADQLPPGNKQARAGDLWAFVARDLDDSGYGLSAHTMEYVQRIARNRGALILLDGLDECGNAATRQRVLGAVRELTRTAGTKCRFLLTARPYAWTGGPDPKQGVYALSDLTDNQIEQFIRGWYSALVTRNRLSPGEGERKMTDLLTARGRPDLLPLARNPLLLTLMATLHTNRGGLPDDRVDLYNESVDLLMLRWNRQIGADKALLDELAVPTLKLSDLREVLEELAFRVHQESAVAGRVASAEQAGTADIGEDRLIRAFRPLLGGSRDKAAIVVDYIEKRAGLLIGRGEKDGERQFTFPHRTFQELLAACHLAAQADFPAECVRLARAEAGHWQLVLSLAARVAKVERGASAADELIGGSSVTELRERRRPDADDWTCAILAGTQLLEIGLGAIRKRERTRAIGDRVTDWIRASLPAHPNEGGLPATDRAHAGDLLAALGDPRFDHDRFHLPTDDMLGFVHIPADPEFRIGTRKADTKRVAEIIGHKVPYAEINDTISPTPDFYIARYPVTVAQFRAFVEATGSEIGDPDALRDPDNRPVRYVDWYEAVAYCDWLNKTLASAPVLDGCEAARLVREGSWQVALPSELEWEKAARGGLIDTVFPWGDTPDPNRANYAASKIGDTSAVGCFPSNGFGLLNMVGDSWEWTRSKYESCPYGGDDDRENPERKDDDWLVVRGGAWSSYRDGARCAFRDWSRPDDRGSDMGFRVVLRSALFPSSVLCDLCPLLLGSSASRRMR